ncbi:MAG: hypothetical protein CVU81_00280 [Euryarchaeota archaeon HGW-Euryarchaeota-1]|nr:MAG: hypothetical protein CVU81_00280 [Euryarchaeota archaeon HGW-Euryarchaeota-1]
MGKWDDWKKEAKEKGIEELPPVIGADEVKSDETDEISVKEKTSPSIQDIDESLLFIKIPDYKQLIEELDKLDVSLKEASEKIIELEKQKDDEMLSIENIKQKIVEFEGILLELNKKFGGRLK